MFTHKHINKIISIYQITSIKLILFFVIVTSIAGNTFVAIVIHLLDILKGQVPQKEFLVQRARIFLRPLVTGDKVQGIRFSMDWWP